MILALKRLLAAYEGLNRVVMWGELCTSVSHMTSSTQYLLKEKTAGKTWRENGKAGAGEQVKTRKVLNPIIFAVLLPDPRPLFKILHYLMFSFRLPHEITNNCKISGVRL